MAFNRRARIRSGNSTTSSQRTRELTIGANAFSRAMTGAFTASVVGGRQFDDVLKSLALRLSNMAVRMAFKPLAKSITGGLESCCRVLWEPLVRAAHRGSMRPAHETLRVRRRHRHTDILSAVAGRHRSRRRGRARGDHAAGARTRRQARRRAAAAAAAASTSRSRRRTWKASAARRITSPARSRARSRVGNGVCSYWLASFTSPRLRGEVASEASG